MTFRAPVNDIGFCLQAVSGLADLQRDGLAGPADADSVAVTLAQAARTTDSLIAPLDRESDRTGARYRDGRVVLAPGHADAYRQWCAGGWMGADAPAAIGGMALPLSVGAALTELWHSGCMGFAMGLVLTQAAAELLDRFGSPELRARYLPRLVSGEWSATMAMTEAQAGSDLGLARTRADPQPDGSYRVSGDKIFISYGDHDATDNVVHMVLARIAGDPPGVHGLSLFLVPKMIEDADGALAANRVACIGIEHKLGLHGSPTCAMRYGDDDEGATGWVVGEPRQGLAAMFTMMNRARLSTGMQGTAVGEKATQQAYAFARQRLQGHGADRRTVPIIEHPDVRRMLLDMRSAVMGARCLSFYAAATLDRAERDPDPAARQAAAARGALLTPIVKAYGSDLGVETASLGVQVHGGMGYIEETGIAQRFRDARIAPIYEGTNGLQAIDLVARKIAQAGPETALILLAELAAIGDEARAAGDPLIVETGDAVIASIVAAGDAIGWVTTHAAARSEILWGARPMLTLLGQTIAGALLLRGAMAPDTDHFTPPADMAALAGFFAQNRLAHSSALAAQVRANGGLLDTADSMTAYA